MTDGKPSVRGDYASSGVDYSKMDPFKRAALQRAQATVPNLIGQRGFRVVEGSYGESAFLVETPGFILAHVLEGLGTKNVVAEAMLAPTMIYKRLIDQCQAEGIDLHYIVNITGHGWRKLMRPVEPWVYVIDRICTPQPEFNVIQEATGMTDRQMYGDYNMGAGFALYVAPEDADRVVGVAQRTGYEALVAGYIKKPADGKKCVCIRPLDIEYSEEELQVR